MQDLLFKTENAVFSYRVAGVVVENDCVLLQKPENDPGYAFPGGHVCFGETNAETLAREFKEEIGADVTVGSLLWVGEIFFPWGNRPCHQLCLYYRVALSDDHTPRSGSFLADEQLEDRRFPLGFHWIPLRELETLTLYPPQCKKLLMDLEQGVQHFIYKEE